VTDVLTAYDGWVRDQRPAKMVKPLDRPIAFWVEKECLYSGRPETVGTIIINNRECPYSCLMCGYWRDTTDGTPAEGQVAGQVRRALGRLPPLRSVKLYNSGSFFDDQAIPASDVEAIAEMVAGIDLVVVECHPARVGPEVVRFRDRLGGRLEVAMGLEVADPQVLAILNKKMSLGLFRRAATYLRAREILVKAFILIKPPFLDEARALDLGKRSVDFALDAGVDTVSLIPTVSTPGVMERLEADRFFAPPHPRTIHEVARHALGRGKIRVLVETGDLDGLPGCMRCRSRMGAVLREVNLRQEFREVACGCSMEWEDLLREDRVRGWKEFRSAYPDLPWGKTERMTT
jgi:radical SAM enzyme (TIGR01210 family)